MFAGSLLQNRYWTPELINPYLWLDASDLSSFTLSSNKIIEWRDKNGITLSQANALRRPSISSVHLEGRNTVLFSGNNLEYLDNNLFTVPRPFAVHCVTRYVAGAALKWLFDGFTSRVAVWASFPTRDGISMWAGDSGGGANGFTGVIAPTTDLILTLNYTEDGAGNIFANGIQGGTNIPVGNNSLSGLRLGSNSTGNQYGFSYISDFLITPILSNNTRLKLEGYLAHKNGLQNSLPINHPYR
jgi:hypothetical protein